MSGAQHSSESPCWYTPDTHLELVRAVLGRIDLDPCSDAHGNARVGAARFIDEKEDGLAAPWSFSADGPITVFMNPPGGAFDGRSRPVLFWERLMAYRGLGAIEHAIVAAFSIEQLQTSQNTMLTPMLAFPFCVPRTRVRWSPRPGKAASSPTHSSAYIYVPGTVDRTSEFRHVFSELGFVRA